MMLERLSGHKLVNDIDSTPTPLPIPAKVLEIITEHQHWFARAMLSGSHSTPAHVLPDLALDPHLNPEPDPDPDSDRDWSGWEIQMPRLIGI